MRSRVLADIRNAASTKGTTSVHHKSRGHKRPSQASNAAIGTGCSKPRGIDRKPTAGRAIAKTCVLQTHTINAHARFGSAPMASPEKPLSSRWSASVQTQPRPDALRAWPRLSIRERGDALWPPHSVPSLNYRVNMI